MDDLTRVFTKFVRVEFFKVNLLLYIFVFIVNFQPASYYKYEFLTTYINNTENQVLDELYLLESISTAVESVVVFFLIGFYMYNYFLIVFALAGVVSTCFFIWGKQLIFFELAECFNGVSYGMELINFVSVIATTDVKNFKQVAVYVRVATLIGRLLSAFLSQFYLLKDWMNYVDLYYLNFAAFVHVTLFSMFLPSIKEKGTSRSSQQGTKISLIKKNLKRSFRKKRILKWIFWISFSHSGFNLISRYIQPLLKHEKSEVSFNGFVEIALASTTLVGLAFIKFIDINWRSYGDFVLAITSLTQAIALFLISSDDNILFCCLYYVIFSSIHCILLTGLFGEIAKSLKGRSLGLVFSFSYMIGNVLSVILNFILHYKGIGYELTSYQQFVIWSLYHAFVSIFFFGVAFFRLAAKNCLSV